jgi:hypothetical protein
VSYWVYLESPPGHSVEVEAFADGGTYPLGGRADAEYNITYNYGALYRAHLHPDGLRWLHGKRAAETVAALECAVATLGTERAGDYWAATPGNAGAALARLLAWARQHPDATWRVS